MAGHGPPPKDPRRRVRGGKGDPVPFRVISVEPGDQPDLVALIGDVNPLTDLPWSRPTMMMWEQLREFPTTAMLLPAQWSSLARAFMLDDAFVSGTAKMAVEARLRFAKFGIDPDDLTRLRVQLVAADEADAKRPVAVIADDDDDVVVLHSVSA